jgi:hypothetical protein
VLILVGDVLVLSNLHRLRVGYLKEEACSRPSRAAWHPIVSRNKTSSIFVGRLGKLLRIRLYASIARAFWVKVEGNELIA